MKLIELYPDKISFYLTRRQYKRIKKLSKKFNISSRALIIFLINSKYKYVFGSYQV